MMPSFHREEVHSCDLCGMTLLPDVVPKKAVLIKRITGERYIIRFCSQEHKDIWFDYYKKSGGLFIFIRPSMN